MEYRLKIGQHQTNFKVGNMKKGIKELTDRENADSFWVNARKNLVLDLIEGKKVLDIGCGTGLMCNSAAEKGYDVTGIDLEKEGIEIARKNAPKNRRTYFVVGDFLKYNFKEGSFDSVIITDVLEHVKNDGEMLRKIFKVLKKGGVLVLTVPAFEFLYGRHDKEFSHYRRYSKKKLEKELMSIGFAIDKSRYWNMISVPMVLYSNILNRTYPTSKNRLNNFFTAYFKLVEKNFNMPIGISLVIKARKPK